MTAHEHFIVGMTNGAKAALERIQRQQGRFRYYTTNTNIDNDGAVGIALKVGTFRHAIRLRGRMRSYKGIADARRRLTATVRSAAFQRTTRHNRNKARHFGRGKVSYAFR